jgi:hypothetical protein
MELDDPEAVDGMLMELGDGTRVAMVNKAKSYVRGRFTLAHELKEVKGDKEVKGEEVKGDRLLFRLTIKK